MLTYLWNHARSAVDSSTQLREWARKLDADEKGANASFTSSSIHAGSVTRWDRFGNAPRRDGRATVPGRLQGWARDSDGSLRASEFDCTPLRDLFKEHTEVRWEDDLQSIQGLAASKSDLTEFDSVSDFAQTICAGLMTDVSLDGLQANLAWKEAGLNGAAKVQRYDWDGRTLLMNEGGSHHFAAAHHLAHTLGEAVQISGQKRSVAFRAASLESVRSQFEIFAIPVDSVAQNAFFEAMTTMGSPHYKATLPEPHGDKVAIFLPRADHRAQRAATILRAEGMWDVGQTLTELAAGVHRHTHSELPVVTVDPRSNRPKGTLGDTLRQTGHSPGPDIANIARPSMRTGGPR